MTANRFRRGYHFSPSTPCLFWQSFYIVKNLATTAREYHF
jgi:hypothetical protein